MHIVIVMAWLWSREKSRNMHPRESSWFLGKDWWSKNPTNPFLIGFFVGEIPDSERTYQRMLREWEQFIWKHTHPKLWKYTHSSFYSTAKRTLSTFGQSPLQGELCLYSASGERDCWGHPCVLLGKGDVNVREKFPNVLNCRSDKFLLFFSLSSEVDANPLLLSTSNLWIVCISDVTSLSQELGDVVWWFSSNVMLVNSGV